MPVGDVEPPYNPSMAEDEVRRLPSVDRLVAAAGDEPRVLLVESARAALAEARANVLRGAPAPEFEDLVELTRSRTARAMAPSLRPVLNATGVILQTNLGRAPLSARAVAAMADVAAGYSNLEYDVDAGERGSRHEHVRELIRQTTGAEDGLVVNNNAAALLMVLQVLARGREVIVSRGQAVEIGGGFRIPDVLVQSGARLVEVGTTNRTYARDYAAAAGPETAAILRVHSSNFQVVGFTAEPALAELVAVGRERGVLVFDDLGSGCLVDTAQFGLAHEPTVQESLAAGTDLVMFSGDKLLGGPQCGIIAGRAPLVAELRRHPLARALRVDRMTIAALNATLAAYAAGTALQELPVWRMAGEPEATIRRRARRWARAGGGKVVASISMVGGGSLPGQGVKTWCCSLDESASAVAERLRRHDPPVIARIEHGAVLLDPRTVAAADDGLVEAAIRAAVKDSHS